MAKLVKSQTIAELFLELKDREAKALKDYADLGTNEYLDEANYYRDIINSLSPMMMNEPKKAPEDNIALPA
jgi:hypothetical protein